MRRIGKCNQCGRCCFDLKTKIVVPDKEGIREHYFNFGYHVHPNGTVVIKSNSKCQYLKYDGKKHYCSIYDKRPEICRSFPWEPRQVVDYCGFRFEDVRNTKKTDSKADP